MKEKIVMMSLILSMKKAVDVDVAQNAQDYQIVTVVAKIASVMN